jgi:outer membrane receptor protein involved in Fe transport
VQDSYSLFNARLGLGAETGNWEIAVLFKNITDEKILSFGGDTPLSGSSFGAKSNYALFGTGRTVSLQAEVRF